MSDLKWSRTSAKRKRNLLLEACGLEATFTPKMVLESLGRDKNGELISVATGRDGRVLWSGKTKLLRSPETKRKFTSPWASLSKDAKRKSARFSYLVGILSQQRLHEKAVKPMVRLSLKFWDLRWDAFVRIIHKILSCCKSTVCRRMSAVVTLRTKPVFTTEIPLRRFGIETVPLWDWRTVRSVYSTPQGATPG